MPIPASFNRVFWVLATAWAVLMGTSCEGDGARVALPGKVGAAGELVVVATPGVWGSVAGDTLQAILGQPYPVLPQYEPLMDVVHLEPELFDRFWKPHRNILILEVADRVDTQKPSFSFFRNKYSRGQIYMVAKARTADALAEVLLQRAGEMVSLLHAEEATRFADIVALSPNEVIAREVLEKWGVQGLWPKDARLAKQEEGFWWIDRQLTRLKGGDNHDIQQGFFIHSEPYVSQDQLSLEHVLNRRDEVTRAHVPGPTKGSYMATERRFFPAYEELEFDGQFALEVRGLWKMENDFMGGPFYSLTIVDEARGRLLTLEGYAYAPYFDKRPYIREVEGVVRRATLLDSPSRP
jgi:hypothetical protein